MYFGVQKRTWAVIVGLFLFAFLSISTAHCFVSHDHVHYGYTTMPFLHTTSNEKDTTLLALALVAIVISLHNVHTVLARVVYRSLIETRLLAYALELFRQLFSSGILHSRSYYYGSLD